MGLDTAKAYRAYLRSLSDAALIRHHEGSRLLAAERDRLRLVELKRRELHGEGVCVLCGVPSLTAPDLGKAHEILERAGLVLVPLCRSCQHQIIDETQRQGA